MQQAKNASSGHMPEEAMATATYNIKEKPELCIVLFGAGFEGVLAPLSLCAHPPVYPAARA